MSAIGPIARQTFGDVKMRVQHQFRFVLPSRTLNKEKYPDTEIGAAMNGCIAPRGKILLTFARK